MASIPESIKNSSVNLEAINTSIKYTKQSTSKVNDSVDNISRIIKNNSRIKNNLFMKSQLIDARRNEASKRQEIEDQIESKKVSFIPKRGLAYAKNLSSGPMSRIMGFLGFVTAGWIVENLPTWMFMGKEFVTRIQKFGGSMYRMVDNIKILINLFGNTLRNSLDAIVRLDFKEFTEGNVLQSFQGMTSTIEDLGKNITDTFNLFRTPLTESMETGEKAPGLGETQPNTMFPGVQQETGASPSGVGTKEQQSLLKVLRKAEGTTSSYGTISGGDIVPELAEGKLTVQETINLAQNSRLPSRFGGKKVRHAVSGATGAYQFMPSTLKLLIDVGVLNPTELFTPQKQDEAALALAKRRGVTAELLQKEGFSKNVSNLLAPEWASIPTKAGVSYYGQSFVPYAKLQSIYQSSLTQSTGQSLSSLPALPPTNTVANQYYGAPRPGRKHAGVDFDIKGPNAKFYSRIGGVVVGSPFRFGADGWATDIYNQQLGVYERIAEAAKIVVKSGQTIKPGDVVAVGESNTGVIHYEIRTKREGEFQNSLDPISFLKNQKPQTAQSSPKLPPAQFSPISVAVQNVSSITPERQGQNILMVDNTQPQIQSPAPQAQSSIAPPVSIDEFKLLNNFIKNKLLLDLAYL